MLNRYFSIRLPDTPNANLMPTKLKLPAVYFTVFCVLSM